MAISLIPCFKQDGDSISVAWARVSVLVPEVYFTEPAIAEDLNGRVSTIFFLELLALDKEGGKERRFAVALPAEMIFNYTDSETLTDKESGEKIRVFNLYKDDVFLETTNTIQNAGYLTQIFKIIAGARIRGVAYENLPNLLIEGSKLSGVGLPIARVLVEAIISELARWDKDESLPLRIPLAKGKALPNEYHLSKLKNIPRLNSVFSGIGFEDINLAVQTAVVKSRTNTKQRISPVEKVIKY
jgi:hypothetical protein